MNAVIYCEFDHQLGPSIVYQYPKDYVSHTTFNNFAEILIPRPELCGKVITVQISPTEYIIGMPITIVNTKYERHKVEFNLALVIEKEEYENIRVYENIVRKMAMYLSLLEDINE